MTKTRLYPTKKEIYAPGNYFVGIEEEKNKAVERIRTAYEFSQRLGLGKLYVCFSGGKDSVAVYGVCSLAFGKDLMDKCEFHYQYTGLDHPELVRFIRREFPFVERHLPARTMWEMIPQHGMPPTRLARYCCRELKERGGEGRFCLTGVRWEESSRRKNNRGEFESDGLLLNVDNTEDRRLLEHCIPKRKHICNPIVDWSDETVWRFISEENLPYCSLYDQGYDRLGCIGCPMDTKREKVLSSYPKYKEAYLRAFGRMLEERKRKGLDTKWKTPEEVMDWWLEKNPTDNSFSLDG